MAAMFERVCKRMREKIRAAEYIVSDHADEKMDDDDLAIYDVECAVLSGAVQERQRDRQTGEWKYRIRGESADGSAIEVVAKIGASGTLFVLTVYRL
jgi:hypothetical protein